MTWTNRLTTLGITPVDGNQFKPLDEAVVESIEKQVNADLPEGYRRFLLTYGPSDFEEYAVFPTSGGGVAPGTFLGSEIEKLMTELDLRLPKGIIPINDDGSGNLVCISVRSDSYGGVYYQSHSIGWDDAETDIDQAKFKTLLRLAPDFASFIQGLEPEN